MAEQAASTSGEADAKKRLASYLFVHLLSFVAQIAAMINFFITRDYFFLCFLLLPFLFSGFFCSHAAWHSSLCRLGQKESDCCCWRSLARLIPLKEWNCTVCAIILAVPLGLFQMVIVLLSFDEYYSKIDNAGSAHRAAKPSLNRFQCKAVNGIFEGILSSAVLLYAYWSLDFPEGDEITKSRWTGEKPFLAIVGLIAFFQAGIGLMDLDLCTSDTVSKNAESIGYEFKHFLFRVCEVTSRVSLFIGFMVNARQKIWWWWVPLAADFAISLFLVAIFGGAEKTWMVRILCAIPCTFANLFLFINSPQKRRAAKKLSRCLHFRHLAQLFLLPILLYASVEGVDTDVKAWWWMHVGTNIISAFAIPLYWVLLFYVTYGISDSTGDIFLVCEKGYPNELDKLTNPKNPIKLNVNETDVEGRTPLMYAAINGHHQVCCILLHKGAKVDIRFFRKHAPLRCLSTCRSMLNRYVQLEWTALHMAAYKGHTEVVRALLDEGLRDGTLDAEDDPQLLSELQEMSLPDLKKKAHEMGCEPEVVDGVDASDDPRKAAIELVLAKKEAIDWNKFFDMEGNTPLHVAAAYGHAGAAGLLAAHTCGRQPDWAKHKNRQQKTPVDLAREKLGTADAETVRRAIEAASQVPTDGGENGRHQPLLPPATDAASSSASPPLPRPPSRNSHTDQAWPMVHVNILQSGDLSAPGLCSYITSSGGGALGKVFLMKVEKAVATGQSEIDPKDIEPIDANGNRVDSRAVDHHRCCCWLSDPGYDEEQAIADRLFGHVHVKAPREAVLGEGAYGAVWRARDKSNGKLYAVKNIDVSRGNNSAIAIRERQVGERISIQPHPCIVYLHKTIYFSSGLFYSLIMDLCPGGELSHKIKEARIESKRQNCTYKPPRLARDWLGQIFLGLEHLHLRMETLLRDLKPANCVFSEEGVLKLTDFGVGLNQAMSRNPEQVWSLTGAPPGSPGYIAPETLKQQESTPKVDLYSFGVVAWVLLTGGVTNREEPEPPCSRQQPGNGWQVFLKDCPALLKCIEDPENNNAVRLADAGGDRDFVKRLTCGLASDRMGHADIRAHGFMEPLDLPAQNDGGPARVEAWLGKYKQHYKQLEAEAALDKAIMADSIDKLIDALERYKKSVVSKDDVTDAKINKAESRIKQLQSKPLTSSSRTTP